MKKTIFAIIVIVIILAGFAAWYFFHSPAAVVSPLSLLPKETMAVARFFNLEQTIGQLQAGKFGQKMKTIDIEGFMAERKMPPENIEKGREMLDDFLDTINSQWFRELFGQDVVVAVLPVSIKKITPGTVEDLMARIVVIASPKRRAEALALLAKLCTDEATVKTISHGTHEIKYFMVEDDVSVYYSLVDGVLLGTLDQNAMQECLDRHDRQGASLANNDRYGGITGRLERPDARMLCYCNVEALYGLLTDVVSAPGETEEDRDAAPRSLAGIKGLKDIGGAWYDDGTEILETRALVSFDKEALDPLYAKFYSSAPTDNETLALVPGEPLLYYWTNCLDVRIYWEYIMENESIEKQEREELAKTVRQHTGASPEELFAALGDQGGLMLADINTAGFVPIPKLVLFMEARDPKVLEGIIAFAVKKTMIQFQVEEYHGITIRSLPLPFGTDVQPAYAFLKGFCLVAMNPQLIRDAVDAHKSDYGLTKAPAFAAVDRGLREKNNTVCFLDVKSALEAVKGVITWQQKMAAFKDPEKARESAPAVEKLVYPLLESLQVIETIGSRAVIGEHEMEAYSYIKVDRE